MTNNITLQELRDKEADLQRRLEFAKKVSANTKNLEKELSTVLLAQQALLSLAGQVNPNLKRA